MTPRLTLRPLEPADIDAIVDGVGNYDVVRWLSQVPYPYTRADAEDFVAGRVTDPELTWAIDAGEGLIGCVSLDGDLGYWVARSAWGRGYGFEAARAVVAHWFSSRSAESLSASHFIGNDRSELVLACLGFRPEGTATIASRALSQEVPCQRMLLTRGDWQRLQRFEVRTPRLRLRELTRSDARALVRIATPAVARMVSSIPESFTVAAAKAYIVKRRWQGLPGFVVGIEGPKGDLVGCLGCGGDPVTAMVFLGEEHWSGGYATEAGAAFIAELFRRFPLSAIHAEHFVDNPASGAVLRKLGFERIGKRSGTSEARLEPAPVVEYRLTRDAYRKTQ